MDDFVYVFVAAVAVLAGMFILFAVVPTEPSGRGDVIGTFSVGEVGSVSQLPARRQTIGSFTIGQTQTQEIRTVPKLEVSTGYFGADREQLAVEIDPVFLNSLKDVVITFDVADTNNYGSLILRWNGLEVFNRKPTLRSHRVVIPQESVKAANTLTVESAGPGFFFWASTVHIVEGLAIAVEYGPEKLYPFEILSSEIQAFNRGDVEFFSHGDSETLIILVNGAEIFNDVPAGAEIASFDLLNAPVSAGTNVITFQAPSGGLTVDNAALNIFLTTNQIVRKGEFELSEEQWENMDRGLRRGVIVFTVDEIIKGGSLDIKLNGNKALPVSVIHVGGNEVAFTSAEAIIGGNEITFSGTGNFIIPEASVVLER